MKQDRNQTSGKSAIELIEEAAHLLRRAPLATLAAYYIGSLPFVIALLYFWAEMSRSPFANDRLIEESLGLAILFVWMKVWQARFARALWSQLGGGVSQASGFRQTLNILLNQSALQVTGLVMLPIAMVLTIPLGWTYAFYQSLTAISDPDNPGLRNAFSKARRQAALWPRQNHLLIFVLSAFGLFVFLNWAVVAFTLPGLAKSLLGIETIFTRSRFAMLNSTFFAAMAAVTYLSVDPLVKAVYTLRCFYGEARATGEDIKAELKQLASPSLALAAVVAAVTLTFVCAGRAEPVQSRDSESANGPVQTMVGRAVGAHVLAASRSWGDAPRWNGLGPLALNEAANQAPISSSPVSPSDLDKRINDTLKEPKYIWRLPRETAKKPSDADIGVIDRFFKRIEDWLTSIRDSLAKILRKLFKSRSPTDTPAKSGGSSWIVTLNLLLYLLIAVVVAGLSVLLYRVLRGRKEKPAAIVSTPIQTAPDLSDENVGAEQLPEDGWTALGRELLQRGELRLALRAFYLGTLSHLASRNLISLARFKSNRDYYRELERRAHALPRLLAAFDENINAFDRAWYGMHEITPDLVSQFLAKADQIKTV